jgi:hypothetical protein
LRRHPVGIDRWLPRHDRVGVEPSGSAGRDVSYGRDTMTAVTHGCWHCGEPLPPDPPQARVAGIAHSVCCHGCRAVAEWIGELGLADYYRLRSEPSARGPDPTIRP